MNKELEVLEIYLDKRIKDIKNYLEFNERSEDEKGFTPSEELQICYLAKRMLAIDNSKKDINSLYSNMHQTSDELDKSLKDSLLKNAKTEAIDNSNPNEALKRIRQETCPATYNQDFDKNKCCDIIEQALTTKHKKELAFDIMNKKNVNTYLLKNAIEIYDYNSYFVTNDERLTQDEFDLLMEVLYND